MSIEQQKVASVDRQLGEIPVDPLLRLHVPIARVAADVVDGEVVVIDLQTGSYYTTEGVGCEAWQLLATERSLGEVVDVLRSRYEADVAEVEAYVEGLVRIFLGEGLMTVIGPEDHPTGEAGVDPLPPVDAPVTFEPADFVSYDDMKGLLLLDPIHEVDDRGWPHAAAGT